MLLMDSDTNPHVMVYSKCDAMGVHVMDPAVEKDEQKPMRIDEFLKRTKVFILVRPPEIKIKGTVPV